MIGSLFIESFEESVETNEMSDTKWIQDVLNVYSRVRGSVPFEEWFVRFFECLRGPFAILYYDQVPNRVIAMRDQLGRRSLCVNVCKNPESSRDKLVISNV